MTTFTLKTFLNQNSPGMFEGVIYAGGVVQISEEDYGAIDLETFTFSDTPLLSNRERIGRLRLWRDGCVVRMSTALSAPSKSLEVILRLEGTGERSKEQTHMNDRTFAPGELIFFDVKLLEIALTNPPAKAASKTLATWRPLSPMVATIPTPTSIKRSVADLERRLLDQVAGVEISA